MKFSSRFFLWAPTGLMVALALGVGIYWWHTATALSARLAALETRAAPGITLHYDHRTISGFPFRIDVVFTNLRVTVETPHGPASWRTEHFALHRLVYDPGHSIFEAAGKQSLDWTRANGAAAHLDFAVGALHASAIDDDKGPARFDLVLVGLGSRAFTAQQIQLHIRRNGDLADLVLALQQVELAHAADAPGRTIAAARLEAHLTQANALDALRSGRQDWRHALEAWRKAGGAMRADDLVLSWGKLNLTGHGDTVLDPAHRPMGLLDLKVAGMRALIADAAPKKGITAALIDRVHAAGENPAGLMGVVIGAKDGIVYVGDAPAGTLAPLY